MSFLSKKKLFKFNVDIDIQELTSVIVSGTLFAKIRQVDGGTYVTESKRKEVIDHRVVWDFKCKFPCKMTASATGYLDSCICRISIRKETKGGKSYTKLGYADIDFAEYAGNCMNDRRYLLEAYDSKTRQDNSILIVNIDMKLISGDICFKSRVPRPISLNIPSIDVDTELTLENKGEINPEPAIESPSSTSSGFGSLSRSNRGTSLATSDLGGSDFDILGNFSGMPLPGHLRDTGHNRTDSQISKVSGYSSSLSVHGHSRHSSLGAIPVSGHTRSPSTGSSRSEKINSYYGSIGKNRKFDETSVLESKVEGTRVDPDQFVQELMTQVGGFEEE